MKMYSRRRQGAARGKARCQARGCGHGDEEELLASALTLLVLHGRGGNNSSTALLSGDSLQREHFWFTLSSSSPASPVLECKGILEFKRVWKDLPRPVVPLEHSFESSVIWFSGDC